MKAVDLFAGAGGCSTGLLQAATERGERVELVAVNHWPISVETHTRNHPEARHFCASIETLDPKVAVPGGKLDLLIAAPECVFHSTARGGKPIDDQRRASAWHVLRWLEHLHVEEVLIENVPEFVKWGPLGKNDRPLKSKQGEIFRAFIAVIESLNYRVEWKVLNAADFGAATTRRRLFIRATRGRRSIAWPEATHSKQGSPTLFGGRKKWRAAREIIDWSLPSQSIFARKRPLQPATIRRIIEGLRRFGGPGIQPFILKLTHGDRKRERGVDEPLPTITTANRGELGLVEPFVLSQGGGGVARRVGDPAPTIVTGGAVGLVEPFLLPPRGWSDGAVDSLERPVRTIKAVDGHVFGLVEPFISVQRNNNTPKSLDEPVPALCTGGHIALVEPLIAKYNSTAKVPKPVSEPLDTVSTRDRFALVQPVVNGYTLDIRFRMLQPHELAAAMSFPKGYAFAGNKGDTIRQIGNAVDCRMAKALCAAILDARAPKSKNAKAIA